MVNFPANYAEQEKYYASEEYQSSAKAAIANNEPLPTYEKNKDLGKEAEKPSETPKSSAPLRYPYTKIDEHDDYMRIEVVKFTPPGLQRAEDSLRLRTSDEIAKKDIKQGTIIINETALISLPNYVQTLNLRNPKFIIQYKNNQ